MSEAVFSYDPSRINGSNGNSFSVHFKVKGYWSGDSISVYGNKKYGSEEWSFSISHSSGGRDTKEVADDATAARNFGLAMIAAANLVDEIKDPKVIARLNAESEQYKKELILQEAERKKRLEQAIADDPALGLDKAKEMVDSLVEDAEIIGVSRGIEDLRYAKFAKIKMKTNGNTTYYVNGTRESKKHVIELLSRLSVRSHVEVKL